MTKFFISDLHLGHKSILDFSPQRGGTNIEEHDEWIIQQWNSVVQKCDMVYVLGDVAFNADALKKVKRLRGQKNLIRGNHDTCGTRTYLEYFCGIYGLIKKHGYWMSHAPIHPDELRGRKNIHGHTHSHCIQLHKESYINVCVEQLNGVPISLEEIYKLNQRQVRTNHKE